MKRLTGFGLMLCLLGSAVGVGSAQDNTTPPPKVLVVMREFLKPGKGGMSHEKTESAFVQAFRAAKWQSPYLAVDALSGRPRSLFLLGYDSFAAWEKDAVALQKNATLSAALDRAGVADGELQSDADSSILTYREDLSLRAPVDLPHMRMFEISLFVVKPGHDKDFEDLAKMYMAAYEKIPEVHWAAYQSMYGNMGNVYVVFNPMKSASEIDAEFGQGKQLEQAMGADGMKKLNDLFAACVESAQTNLFLFNPRESYPSEAWIKGDPEFWAPKAAAAKAKPAN